MKKYILAILLFLITACTNKQSGFLVSGAMNENSIQKPLYHVDASGLTLFKNVNELKCNIIYENGLLLEEIPYPFNKTLSFVSSSDNPTRFSNFTLEILDGDQKISLQFHNSNCITVNDFSFSLNELEIRSDLNWSKECCLSILTGQNIPLEVFIPNEISKAEFIFYFEEGKIPTTLSILNEKLFDDFLTSLKKEYLIPYDEEKYRTKYPVEWDDMMLKKMTLQITDQYNHTIELTDWKKSQAFRINEEKYILNGDPIFFFAVNLMQDELFYFILEASGFSCRYYLSPIYYKNEDILIEGTAFFEDDFCSMDNYGVIPKDFIFNYQDYGFSAYEEGILLEELPQDLHVQHFIEFHDKNGNIYGYQYKRCDN